MIYSYGIIALCDNYVLLVLPRDSYAFRDFMNGKRIDLGNMRADEKQRLCDYDFDNLYKDMNCNKRSPKNSHRKFFERNIDIVRQRIKNYDTPTTFWGFPKGHPFKNEKHIDTAKREFFEETNLRVTNIEDKMYRHIYLGTDGKEYCANYYVAKFNTLEQPSKIYIPGLIRPTMVSEEIIDCKWVPIEEASLFLDHDNLSLLSCIIN